METKTHYKKLIDPRYLGAYSLPTDGSDMIVTIDFAQRETVTMAGGKKEGLIVCHLVGQKPLILNATNSKSIAKLYGPYIEGWVGKRIALYPGLTNFGAEKDIECVRIKPRIPNTERRRIPDDRFNHAVNQIKAGAYTEEKLRAYALTPQQDAILKKAMQEHFRQEMEWEEANAPA